MNRLLDRWTHLCQVAGRHQVPILAGYEHADLDPQAWDGLWIRHPQLGPAIALSAALDMVSACWVLAHELGHQFTSSRAGDAAAHLTTQDSQKRWGQGRVHQPDEAAANLWAAQELITADEWADLEEAHPESLDEISKALQLPTAAALWRARAEQDGKNSLPPVKVRLDRKALELLTKPINGQGGHQSFLRHLQRCLSGSTLYLSRKDFNRIREYLLRTGGGFRSRYQAIMDCTLRGVAKSGSLRRFFHEEAAVEIAPVKEVRRRK